MPSLPSRKELEAMKRIDIQRICKDYGVRANLKTDALIDLLLDTQSTPPPQPTRRSVSTRQTSSKAGPSRVSSMIVHDIDEDEEQDEEQDEHDTTPEATKQDTPPPPPPLMIPAPRTRKAKELQTRLGVGKPHVAGGQGPRAITRSSGSLKSRGLKASRSIKPMEATIEEEPEPTPITPITVDAETSKPKTRSPSHNLPDTSVPSGSDKDPLDVRKMVEDAMRPLEEQIRLLKLEVTQIHTIKSELATLRTEVAEVCKTQEVAKAETESLRDLSTVVASLKEELKRLREGSLENRPPSQPSTPKAQSAHPHEAPTGFGMPSAFKMLATAPSPTRSKSSIKPKSGTSLPPHPGIAESMLGKRHRDLDASNVTGIVEEGQEEEYSENELAKKVLRPTKKRPRIEKDDDSSDQPAQGSSSRQASSHTTNDEHRDREASSSNAMHTFTVFRGSDEPMDYADPPPPTNHLPDFFREETPPTSSTHISRPKSRTGIPTSSANAAENQPQTFGFGFLPISSTPQDAMYMGSFPYPEPQSPTPSGSNLGTFMGRNDDRLDPFRSFGFPSPIRSTRNYGILTQDDRGVNPAALTQGSSTKREPATTTETRAAPADVAASMADPPLTTKRTMYGTELEGDTRFGDFGLEGMATSYWASGKF